MQNKTSWLKELSRDYLAIGSWIFYILVIARAAIQPYRPFLDQLIIAALPVIILQLITKKPNYYLARVIPLATFTILFYDSTRFTIFAMLIALLLIPASYFAKNHKIEILYGLVIGAVATLIGYYIPTIYT